MQSKIKHSSVLKGLLLSLGMFLVPLELSADQQFLQMPIESQSMSMGGTGVSRSLGVASMRTNPAGLGFMRGNEAQLTHQIVGNDFNANSVLASYAFAPYFSAGIFGTAYYLKESFTVVEDFKESTNTVSVIDGDLGVSVGYQIMPDVSIGTSIRYFRMQLGPQVSQNFGADLGFLWKFNFPGMKPGFKKFGFGSSVRNLGPGFDFYGGGYKESQPLLVSNGLSFEPNRYFIVQTEHRWSSYEGNSFHAGLQILPDFYFSPRMGITKDFGGLSYSFGGGFGIGSDLKISAIAGTTLGYRNTGNDIYFSLLMHQNKFSFDKKEPLISTAPKEKIIEETQINYRPFLLVPFKSGYRAEKVQGIILSSESAGGYKENNMRLRLVAVQPEDEPYLQRMNELSTDELFLRNRKMGVWVKFENLPGDRISWWDLLATSLEETGKLQTMLGEDLGKLNSNPNAPLRVEWKLEVKHVPLGGKNEIRTALFEMYTNTLVAAKNFTYEKDEDPTMVWQDAALFYTEYFRGINSFYQLRMARK